MYRHTLILHDVRPISTTSSGEPSLPPATTWRTGQPQDPRIPPKPSSFPPPWYNHVDATGALEPSPPPPGHFPDNPPPAPLDPPSPPSFPPSWRFPGPPPGAPAAPRRPKQAKRPSWKQCFTMCCTCGSPFYY